MAEELKRHKKWRLTKDSTVIHFFLIFILINIIFPFHILIAFAKDKLPLLILIVCLLGLLALSRFLKAKDKFGVQSVFTAPQSTFLLFEDEFYSFIIMTSFTLGWLMSGLMIFGLLWLVLLVCIAIERLKIIKENNQLIQKFGTSYLINDSFSFERGEIVGVFFQNGNLIKYTDSIIVTLRNIEEKPIKEEAQKGDYPKGKFFSHFEQSRKYNLENNKIGLVLDIPIEAGFETEYDAAYPIYWELEVKNEACGFHHRFIIDVYDTVVF